MKYGLKFSKTVCCNNIKKADFVPSSFDAVVFPFRGDRHIVK